jgi:polysaccharide pyruvyl transferase WcaK-like protein
MVIVTREIGRSSEDHCSFMTTLFCVRPALPNIGNDLINRATTGLLHGTFGENVSIVDIPALDKGGWGGLTAKQIYDMNRFADGVIVGGGNLFENGQITLDRQALDALRAPLMLIGLSHGRVYDRSGVLAHRSDSMAPASIRDLVAKSQVAMVRDAASKDLLEQAGAGGVELAGCPSLFMTENAADRPTGQRVLLSIRHPARMSVPSPLQWRTVEDVRRLIAALKGAYGDVVHLLCHDYMDLDFAAAFPETPYLYFDDVERYITALRDCRLNVSYRLHAFLPCLSFGVQSIHLSYDERGKAMVATAGMGAWDIDLTRTSDVVESVMSRARDIDGYRQLRLEAQPTINELKRVTLGGVGRFARAVEKRMIDGGRTEH